MANEIVDKILDFEKKSDSIIDESKKKAELIIDESKKTSHEILNKAYEDANRDQLELLNSIEAEANIIIERERLKKDDKLNELHDKFINNIDDAINLIYERIVVTNGYNSNG